MGNTAMAFDAQKIVLDGLPVEPLSLWRLLGKGFLILFVAMGARRYLGFCMRVMTIDTGHPPHLNQMQARDMLLWPLVRVAVNANEC